MHIHSLSVGMLGTNGFIIEEGPDAVVVDPGDEAPRFEKIIKQNNLKLHAILITHGHGDHIGGVREMKDLFPEALLICHQADRDMLRNPKLNLSAHVGMILDAGEPDRFVEDNEVLNFGSLEIEVRHIPGHTRGHVVYVIDGKVFAGDTLFNGGIGRWDFPGGNGNLLIASIRKKIFTLPDETVVYPGHGPETTVGMERKTNPFFTQNYDIDALGW